MIMQANSRDRCVLYWIRSPRCVDRHRDGYIGLTKNLARRWPQGRRRARFPRSRSIVILFRGTRRQCAEREHRYRPRAGIGWNRHRGGGRWRSLFARSRR
jgi:hypothetical protein